MALIIDGYNLLNVTGIVGRRGTGSSLERSRTALLSFLAGRLTLEERRTTTLVFDARQAPPGLQPTFDYDGMAVRFARPHGDADDLIEELIRRDTSPRRLTVVSSDHRLHRAARRRKATPIDSEIWFRQLLRRPVQTAEPIDVPEESEEILTSEEIGQWLRIFSEPDDPPQASQRTRDSQEAIPTNEFDNPFPPGYGEDLLEGDDVP